MGTEKPPDQPDSPAKGRAGTEGGETVTDKPVRSKHDSGETIAEKVPRRADTESGETVAGKPSAQEPDRAASKRAGTESGDTVAAKPAADPDRSSSRARSPVVDEKPQMAEPDFDQIAKGPEAAGGRAESNVDKRARASDLPEPDFDKIARTPLPVPGGRPSTSRTHGGTKTHGGSSVSLTTAAEAMHSEEVRRTRQFIALGWGLSLASIGSVPFVDTPYWMDVALIVALLWGIVLSSYMYRRFADPRKYSERQMLTLGIAATINSHVAVLYYGTFTASPLIMVLGVHFLARSEAEKAGRYLFATGVICYLACSMVIVSGIIDDPGVFATDLEMSRLTLATGALFIVGVYALAYYTGRAIRAASLSSIEGLQRQTRLAAQRKALMDELRADLERALRVGGPGRHTDQTVGSFKLGMVIGRGAMGEVYEGTHVQGGEQAAVKLLRRELLADPTHVARFLRESKASGTLASAHVVKVLEASAGEAGIPFLAMERLHGQTLAEHLRVESRLDPQVVVELCKQVGEGVDVAGAAGIVHRDLKPQNMMLARQTGGGEVWKILDFGVATLADDSGTLTQGGIVGTPSYMAPEQAKGNRVDARADVYAIAAVAYRCLTGRHPFTAPDTPALLYAVVHRMPMRPCELGVFDPDLDRWAAIALAKDPEDRFATGAQLAEALAAALRGELDGKLRRKADALIKKHGWEVG